MSDRALTRHRGRLTISRRKAGSGYDENSHAHQVYMSALRCCAWPILAASKEPVRTPLSNPGGSHGGLGGLAGGVSSLSSLSGLVEAREESFVQGNTVILSPQAVNAFKVKVPERATFLKMVTKEREQIFAKSAFNLYNRLLSTPTFNPRMIGDLSTLIELIGAYIDRELTNLPPEQHDDLLLQVMSLYISIVKESLQRADPKVSKAVLNHPLLGDGFKPLLSKFMKNIKEIKGDNTGTSLTDWLRVIFNVPKVDHDRFVAKAKQTMNERVAFGDLTIFLDQLSRDRVPSASPDDFRGGQEYQTYKQTEAGVLSGLINALKLRYPDIARVSEKNA
ncbi:hypothetical protein HK102_001526 [Quaeritorhiza haematococci]|nr:hypothetical protein HK102_001526 [Quaeritorhiza haematococci]